MLTGKKKRKTDGKRPLGGNRRRWEDDIKIDFRKWDVEDVMD
jgi:hypothetical protein